MRRAGRGFPIRSVKVISDQSSEFDATDEHVSGTDIVGGWSDDDDPCGMALAFVSRTADGRFGCTLAR